MRKAPRIRFPGSHLSHQGHQRPFRQIPNGFIRRDHAAFVDTVPEAISDRRPERPVIVRESGERGARRRIESALFADGKSMLLHIMRDNDAAVAVERGIGDGLIGIRGAGNHAAFDKGVRGGIEKKARPDAKREDDGIRGAAAHA